MRVKIDHKGGGGSKPPLAHGLIIFKKITLGRWQGARPRYPRREAVHAD